MAEDAICEAEAEEVEFVTWALAKLVNLNSNSRQISFAIRGDLEKKLFTLEGARLGRRKKRKLSQTAVTGHVVLCFCQPRSEERGTVQLENWRSRYEPQWLPGSGCYLT